MADPLTAAVAGVTGQTPASGAPAAGSGLAGQAAAQNIAAAPSLDALAQIISGINQKAYLSAPGRQAQVGNIQNELAGNLDPQTVQAAQLAAAERYGGSGFGADSGAWQSAIQRATGINREALKGKGATDLNALYSGMPVTDASQFAVTPALLQQQQQAAAQLAEQSREFDTSTAQGQSQFLATLEQRKAEAAQAAAQAGAALSEQQREYDLTHSSTVANQIAVLQEQAREANQSYQLEATKVQMAQSQFAQSQEQQQNQFAAQLAQQQAQFGITSGQNAANLYAQTYGTLPGFNQYGMYTGQIGNYNPTTTSPMPTTPTFSLPNNLLLPPFNTGATSSINCSSWQAFGVC